MSDLDRILTLARHGIDNNAQSQVPAERELKEVPVTKEAVGEFSQPLYDLQDELGLEDNILVDEMARWMSGQDITEFVENFRRHHDMPEGGHAEESVEAVTEDDSQDRQIKAWADKWSKYEGLNGDPLPKGWVQSLLDTGITTDGIEANEAYWAIQNKFPNRDSTDIMAMAAGGIDDEVDWGDHDTYDRPITDAMLDELRAILGVSGFMDEEEARIVDAVLNTNESKEAIKAEEPVEEGKKKDHDKDGDIDSDDYKAAKDKAIKKAMKEETITEDCSCGHGADCDCGPDCKCGCNAVTEETVTEAPTMDTTQLITLLKNAGLTEEAINKKLNEWANTPEGAAEEEETSHGEPYENFAQSVNLSLKRYLDAEDFKVGLKEHKVEDIKEAYQEFKGVPVEEKKKD